MSLIDKLKEFATPPAKQTQVQVVPVVAPEEAEAKLRRKAGVLAAFGLNDKAIADTLFISLEQVAQIKETVEFKESCAKQTYERTQRLIDMEEGIDSVESMALARIMTTLQHSTDPEYALRAFAVANRANRRAPASLDRVIDASKVGNVITLTVNKNYINHVTNNEGGQSHAIVETQKRIQGEIPRKASDVSSPKRLSEILDVKTEREKEAQVLKLAEMVGISIDELDEIIPNGS